MAYHVLVYHLIRNGDAGRPPAASGWFRGARIQRGAAVAARGGPPSAPVRPERGDMAAANLSGPSGGGGAGGGARPRTHTRRFIRGAIARCPGSVRPD